MDDVSVFTRLSKIGLDIFPITVEDEIKEFSVSRAFLSTKFGGGRVDTYPTIEAEKFRSHGFGNFMYVNLVSRNND